MKLLSRQWVQEPFRPERVLQFGTGVLLRGLPDYFIDKANRAGLFNGSIAVVKSTAAGGTDAFARQDNLYTLHIKGLERKKKVQDVRVIAAISRVIHAADSWSAVLDVARDPAVETVISNTTEVGIVHDVNDDPLASPPVSFPGKLTAVLYERFRAFGGADDRGMVVLPTELIDKNGEVLRDIVIALAERAGLESGFVAWVRNSCLFCNTLVDRIVPGSLSAADRNQAERELGSRDELAIMAEPYCLWAIEASHPRVAQVLSFAAADPRVVITPDIEKFKELKLRLLNGSHTFACGLALLCGFRTVKEAMADQVFSAYVRELMDREIIPTLEVPGMEAAEATDFADHVIDRFGNPYLHHQWESISTNYASKMRMRNLPTLDRFVRRFNRVPICMALGFAGYLAWMQSSGVEDALDEWDAELQAFPEVREAVHRFLNGLKAGPARDFMAGVTETL